MLLYDRRQIGNMLLARRRRLGLTQEEVAEAAELSGRAYADIERVRFPNIRVEYEIEDSGFSLPPLSVQPIVENAIRHGVRIREEGVIRVSARRTEGGHEVVIADNGVGFDVAAAAQDEGTHIGLKNVQERIETMCGGSVTVDSRLGEGTTVTLFIPEREKEERA